jgi:hypothetical protein
LAVPILDALVAEGGAVRKVVRNGVEQFERSDSAVTPKYE